MERIYSVTINGRTLESHNLKELLARAVHAKRNLGQARTCRTSFGEMSPAGTDNSFSGSEIAAVH
jgi:hypothetical protein